MPTFKPFRGVRPHNDFVDVFPTLPIENFSQEEINKKAAEDSSYIQMIKPYVCSKSKDVDRNLRKVRTNYEEMLAENKLVQDSSSYYLYEQILPNKTIFRGLLGLISIEDFVNGKIKRHETALKNKYEKFTHYLEKVHLHAEPLLLTYQSSPKVELLMSHEEKNVPIINYADERGIRHKVWRIDNRLKLQQFKEVLDQIETFYLADGNHRIDSSAKYAQKLKEKNKRHNGNEPYNFVLSYLVSNQSIKIHDYNRLVKDLNGLSEEEFLAKISENFLIHEKKEKAYYPSQKYHISMYMGGKFYSLHVKHELRNQDMGLDSVDHHLLFKYILSPILGIENDKEENERLSFIKGSSDVEGILKIKEKVDYGEFTVGFGLHPVGFNDITKLTSENLQMPPKCTYIEPKLVTALLMYDMD